MTPCPQFANKSNYTRENIRNSEIRVLGVSMRNYWQFLEGLLLNMLKEPRPATLHIEIAMTDPKWKELNDFRDPDMQKQALAQFESIQRFTTSHQAAMDKHGWSLQLSFYRHMPHIYGFLLDDDVLFVGTTVWDAQDRLSGGHSLVERYDVNDSFNGSTKIVEFAGWHRHSFQKIVVG